MNLNCPNCDFSFDKISTNPNFYRCDNCGCVFVNFAGLSSLATIPPASHPYARVIKRESKICPLDGATLRLKINAFDIPLVSPFVCDVCQNFLLYPDDLPAILHKYLDPKKSKFSQIKSHMKTFLYLFVLLSIASISTLYLYTQGNLRESKATSICDSKEIIKSFENNTFVCLTKTPMQWDYSLISCDGVATKPYKEENSNTLHLIDFEDNDCYLVIKNTNSATTRFSLR